MKEFTLLTRIKKKKKKTPESAKAGVRRSALSLQYSPHYEPAPGLCLCCSPKTSVTRHSSGSNFSVVSCHSITSGTRLRISARRSLACSVSHKHRLSCVVSPNMQKGCAAALLGPHSCIFPFEGDVIAVILEDCSSSLISALMKPRCSLSLERAEDLNVRNRKDVENVDSTEKLLTVD